MMNVNKTLPYISIHFFKIDNEAHAAVEDFVNGKESAEQFAIRLDRLVSQMQGS